ncbi:glycoside hydrolase family 38 C-terminal domain-containing protein [Chengkuizengella sediminis]|uniref:glycoside hydrolase family 38 N-terminal domain-containing protein n=1 Tax=Chengkuizengella sediminis TaxID=1885917 RepID=UPI00138A0A1F|nr:alpha-mannosidase [Chengkuizengella sediminis]
MEKLTAHIISHSHWDREWYMPFEKHRYDLVKLIDRLLDLFQIDPRFKSFHLDGQTVLLEDYLEIRPERKQELMQAIQDKKIYIGPWYVLQDAFLTSSEANVRNLLYGLQDSKQYGVMTKLGYFPDTFGIYGQAPQLLKQAGIETAAFGRGVKPTGFNNTVGEMQSYESPFSEMNWLSPDGSSVLGILFANWYSNGNEIPVGEDAKLFWDKKLNDVQKYASTPHLLFMNGCDHQPVQKDIGEAIEKAKELYPNIQFVHSNFDDYIEAIHEHLPENLQSIHGELRNQRTDGWSTLVNTASARIYLKQMNQECQSLLEKAAEPLSVMAYSLGFEYPRHYLRYAWKTLMQNHPHDSICGCSVDEVHREMVTRFEKAKQTTEMIIDDKTAEIAANIHTNYFNHAENSVPLVVFNASGKKRNKVITKVIEFEKIYFEDMPYEQIPDYLQTKPLPKLNITDSNGIVQLSEIKDKGVKFGYDLPDDGFRKAYFAKIIEVQFMAKDLPGLGYSTYYVTDVKMGDHTTERNILTSDRELENEFLHIEIHDNGSYTLTYKETGKVYHQLGIYENTGDIGNEYMFKKTQDDSLTTEQLAANITVIENNPLRAAVEIVHNWEIPKCAAESFEKEKLKLTWHKNRSSGRSDETTVIQIRTRLALDKKAKGPHIKALINNSAKDHRIRVLYPTNLHSSHHYADSIFEVVKRNNQPEIDWENPNFDHHQQAFISVSDENQGLTIGNKGLNEYEVLPEKNTIAVTILRSVSELGDWGVFPTPEAQCLGENTAEWTIIPHVGNVVTSQMAQQMYEYQTPLIVVQTDSHDGDLPKAKSFLQWQGQSLALTSVKLAEESNDIMTRWFNTSDKNVNLTATFEDTSSHFHSNIVEEKYNVHEGNEIRKTVKPYEIITLGWGMEKRRER